MKLPVVDLERYRHLREIMRRHHNALVGMIPRSTLLKCARNLEVLQGNTLLLESDSELAILMDYCIYSHRKKGRNLVEKYLAKLPPTSDLDEKSTREAMRNARFSMFRIEKVACGSGALFHDLVRGERSFVVDELLSRTIRKGWAMGGRLAPFAEYWITTGAAFPVSEDIVELVTGIFVPALEMIEGDLTTLSAEADEELATVVIGAALKEGTTSEVEYR